jgi:hypothetical protein
MMTTTLTISPDEEWFVGAVGTGILICTAAVAVIGVAAWGWLFMANAVMGGGLMWANYRLFVRLIRALLAAATAGEANAKWFAVQLALVELALFGAVVGMVALNMGNAAGLLGLLAGLLSLPASIAGAAVTRQVRGRLRSRIQEPAGSEK